MNTLIENSNYGLLGQVRDFICESIQTEFYRQNQDRFVIATFGDLQGWARDNFEVIQILGLNRRGLAFCRKSFEIRMNPSVHLIIVNEVLCRIVDLNLDELIAAVLHEMGHLLNDPSNAEPLMKEVYADSYVDQNGYREHLIASFEKYLALPDALNRAMFQQRRESLEVENRTYLVGKPIDFKN